MRIFVINMDKSRDRMAFVDEQLRNLGVTYERVSAVDGRNLTTEMLKKSFNAFRWWCAVGYAASPAEIGCALSHLAVYQKMIAEGLPFACILEDDVTLSPDFSEQIKQVESQLRKDKPQVVLLSDHTGIYVKQNIDKGFKLVSSRWGTCADGYCLTCSAAKALIAENFPICVPCDWWGRWVDRDLISLSHALPPVCRQEQKKFGSSTSDGRVAVADLPFAAHVLHAVKRGVGKAIDFCFHGFAFVFTGMCA